VLTVTLSRPEKHNALSRKAIADLRDVFTRFAEDRTVRVAVLTGAGNQSFAAGGDLKDLEAVRTLDQARQMSSETRLAFDAIRRFPAPVVAALNGNAVGGGAELASACDFRVAAPHARIGFVQGKLGITTAWGGGIDICTIVGHQRALWLTLSGTILKSEEALSIGLYDAVAGPDEQVLDAAVGLVASMLKQPRQVLDSFKQLNRAVRDADARLRLEHLETELFAQAWVSDAHWEALDAFNSRRK
jgi:enoyl-CoA hydratase